jgi:hypothetical protein
MSKTAFTIKAFGIYLLFLGILVTLAPNLLLTVFGIPQKTEVWVRVVGVLVFNIGIYYLYAAKCEAAAFFSASVYTRTLVLISFVIFALLDLASPMMILFGVVDFSGGLWTLSALRSDSLK